MLPEWLGYRVLALLLSLVVATAIFVRVASSRAGDRSTFRLWIHGWLLLLITVGAVVHHCVLFEWYIEDAAISFAYAKHLAMGEGLVPFIGGERVEGYSNPSWVFFLAPFHFVGLDLHDAARWLQVFLCIPTVPVVYLAAREALGRESDAALVAPAVLAASSQFALWGGAGLEMALMNLLMAMAVWRSLVELRTGSWPWSALWWFGVTISRPEAILYAAVAGFAMMVATIHARRSVGPTLRWLLTFFLPFGLYHAWRYTYFAWEFPNTYYGKLERRPEMPLLTWAGKSWKYTRNFMSELGWGFFLPVWVLGIVGHARWRLPVVVVACLTIGLSVQLAGDQRWLLAMVVGVTLMAYWIGLAASEDDPPRWLAASGLGVAFGLIALSEYLRWRWGMTPNAVPTPEGIESVPPYVLIAAGVLLPLLGVGARGWPARLLVWLLCMAAVLFALIAQWDWMNGFRWYAPAVVPGALLFALGASDLASVVQRALSSTVDRWTLPGYATLGLVTLAVLPANVAHTERIAAKPQTKPEHVHHRVKFVNRVRDRLHVEGRLVDLDVDQGAHLFWSDFEMLDIAGLIDVPLAQHKFERAFVEEYLFEEKRPHFAHVHGGWASNSRIPTHKQWRSDYLEIPGYPANRTQMHIGNHVRRDLITVTDPDRGIGRPGAWPFSDPVALEGPVRIHGVHVPSAPAVGRTVYVEVGLDAPKKRKVEDDDFRLLLTASNAAGALHVWELPPGYDWLWPHEWHEDEIFVGRFSLSLPEELVEGVYDLGLVVVDRDGQVPDWVEGEARVGGTEAIPARYMVGELQYPGTLRILSVADRAAEAKADRTAAHAAVEAGDCERAEEYWFLARKHRAGEDDWVDEHAPTMLRALSTCYAVRSDGLADDPDKVEALVRARELDHWNREYRRRGAALAADLHRRGLEARANEDWERAYRLFADAVDVDRRRSWSRRYAEEARAFRLGIDPETLAAEEAEQERVRQANAERRKALLDKEEGGEE